MNKAEKYYRKITNQDDYQGMLTVLDDDEYIQIERMESYHKEQLKKIIKSKEIKYNQTLFSAYLTGQTDVRNRENGLKGRRFKDWALENNETLEKLLKPIE